MLSVLSPLFPQRLSLSSHLSQQLPEPLQHQRVSPALMLTFDVWRPKKLVEHGDQQISAAVHLLASYGAQLSRSRRDQAQGLLD